MRLISAASTSDMQRKFSGQVSFNSASVRSAETSSRRSCARSSSVASSNAEAAPEIDQDWPDRAGNGDRSRLPGRRDGTAEFLEQDVQVQPGHIDEGQKK